MSFNFSSVKEFTIPEGNVVKIIRDADESVIWEKRSGMSLGDLEVGSSVFMNVDGVSTEFLVVHQGLPSSVYDSSCDGTWLLMKNIRELYCFSYTFNDYANSLAHSRLDSSILARMDSGVSSIVKQVKIPYTKGYGTSRTLCAGSTGLSTKMFLLSYSEVGSPSSMTGMTITEGSVLSYFNGATNSIRIAAYNGVNKSWWLRSPMTRDDVNVMCVESSGSGYYSNCEYVLGLRPAMILPSETLIDGTSIWQGSSNGSGDNESYEPV